MNLTKSEIQNDIEIFEAKISIVRQKLADLPEGYLPFQEHRKREKKRRDLQDDIRHFQQIIKIATDAVSKQPDSKNFN